MRKLSLILLLAFTVTLSSCKTTSKPATYSNEWTYIEVTPDGNTVYVNLNNIERRDGFVFFTALDDKVRPFNGHNIPTVMSGTVYFQGDCEGFRLKPIRFSAFGKPMGKEHVETEEVSNSAWVQVPPSSYQGTTLRKVCDH